MLPGDVLDASSEDDCQGSQSLVKYAVRDVQADALLLEVTLLANLEQFLAHALDDAPLVLVEYLHLHLVRFLLLSLLAGAPCVVEL